MVTSEDATAIDTKEELALEQGSTDCEERSTNEHSSTTNELEDPFLSNEQPNNDSLEELFNYELGRKTKDFPPDLLEELRSKHIIFVDGILNELAMLVSNYFDDNMHQCRKLGIPHTHLRYPSTNSIPTNSDLLLSDILRISSDVGRPIILIGHSMGGAESLYAVLTHPDLLLHNIVDRVILIQAALGGSPLVNHLRHNWLGAIAQRLFGTALDSLSPATDRRCFRAAFDTFRRRLACEEGGAGLYEELSRRVFYVRSVWRWPGEGSGDEKHAAAGDRAAAGCGGHDGGGNVGCGDGVDCGGSGDGTNSHHGKGSVDGGVDNAAGCASAGGGGGGAADVGGGGGFASGGGGGESCAGESEKKEISLGLRIVLAFCDGGSAAMGGVDSDGLMPVDNQILGVWPPFGVDLGVLEADHIELVVSGFFARSDRRHRKAFTRALFQRVFSSPTTTTSPTITAPCLTDAVTTITSPSADAADDSAAAAAAAAAAAERCADCPCAASAAAETVATGRPAAEMAVYKCAGGRCCGGPSAAGDAVVVWESEEEEDSGGGSTPRRLPSTSAAATAAAAAAVGTACDEHTANGLIVGKAAAPSAAAAAAETSFAGAVTARKSAAAAGAGGGAAAAAAVVWWECRQAWAKVWEDRRRRRRAAGGIAAAAAAGGGGMVWAAVRAGEWALQLLRARWRRPAAAENLTSKGRGGGGDGGGREEAARRILAAA